MLEEQHGTVLDVRKAGAEPRLGGVRPSATIGRVATKRPKGLGRYRREPGSVEPEQLLVELADEWAGYGEDWAAGLEKNIYPPYVRSLDTLTEMAYEFLAVLVNGHE